MKQEAEHIHDLTADHQPHQFDSESDSREVSFRVHWPPIDPARDAYLSRAPLLNGKLCVSIGNDQGAASQLNVRIELVRPEAESARERWNEQLAFPEYDWMSAVRVWDAEKLWLWPNLPYLLRAHGVEREQRYGGVDPGKGVDNDFAAVVVKRLDSDDRLSRSSDQLSMVTAEWHPPAIGIVSKTSVVHTAISDDLSFSIGDLERERFGVWLVYADFLSASPPATWPKEAEFDGGVLSYFEVECQAANESFEIVSAKCIAPSESTGVAWDDWLKQGKPKRFATSEAAIPVE